MAGCICVPKVCGNQTLLLIWCISSHYSGQLGVSSDSDSGHVQVLFDVGGTCLAPRHTEQSREQQFKELISVTSSGIRIYVAYIKRECQRGRMSSFF
jgi:hypothetical protein